MLVAAISTGWAVAGGTIAASLGAFVALYKLRPERDALIAQAAEHATNAVNVALEHVRRELNERRDEVDHLRREVGELRDRERELLAKIAELELELARMQPSPLTPRA